MRKIIKYVGLAIVLFLLVGQLIRPDRTNPAVNQAMTFEAVARPGPEVVSIVKRACYDCHSNGTVWPWYSRVAPVSWLVADDVKEGRAKMNFSDWGLLSPEIAAKRWKAICEEAKAGEMPLWQYRLMHAEAKLAEPDVNTLCGAASQVAGAEARR